MKRCLAGLLVVLFIFPMLTLGQKSVHKLRKGLEDVKHSKRIAEKKLAATKVGISDVKVQMGTIENRLQKVSNQLEDATDQLSASRARQAILKGELDKANAGVAAKKIQVERRIRSIYKEGKPNVIEFFFGSKSAADLSTREFIANRVEMGDRKMFSEFQTVQEAAKKKKEEQDAEVRRVRQLMVQQESKQQELNSAQKEKEGYLQVLKNKKQNLETILDELDSDAADIESEIKVAVARAREIGRAHV